MTATCETHPAPFVPADTDLRDYPSMLIDIDRLLNSDFNTITDDRAWRAAFTLWLKSFRQVPASSLPNDEASLAGLAGYGREMKAWAKARHHIMRHWVPCSDGRLYHRVVSEKALEAWVERLHQRKASGAGNQKQWNVPFDGEAIQAQIDEALLKLAELNPESRIFRKRGRKLASRTPEACPDGSPTGTENRSHRDSHREAERDPVGAPDAIPERSPRRSQAEAEAKANYPSRKDGFLDSEGSSSPLGMDRPADARPGAPPDDDYPFGRGPDAGRSERTVAAPKPARATRLAPDWMPDVDDRRFATSEGFADREIDRIGDGFRDHWLGKSGQDATKVDWHATWRNWIRNEGKRAGSRNQGGDRQGPMRSDQVRNPYFASMLRDRERKAAAAAQSPLVASGGVLIDAEPERGPK